MHKRPCIIMVHTHLLMMRAVVFAAVSLFVQSTVVAGFLTSTSPHIPTVIQQHHPLNNLRQLQTRVQQISKAKDFFLIDDQTKRLQHDDLSTTTIKLWASSQNDDEGGLVISSSPLDQPLLALLDVISLCIFAGIGKASHAPDGSIDLGAVLITAFPFVTSWIVTSPLTGVYKPLQYEDDAELSTIAKVSLSQTATGWALAIPLGCALRGIIKGYIPPIPFVIVTLISTLIILGAVRTIYAVAETKLIE